MKYLPSRILLLASLTLLMNAVGTQPACAGESFIYSPLDIHHSATGSSTVTIRVPSHYDFVEGKYVWVSAYSAEAPLPTSPYDSVFWISPTTNEAGHWSRGSRTAGAR